MKVRQVRLLLAVATCALALGVAPTAYAQKITGDITQMAAQIPALFETLSGMKMSELLGKVKAIGDKSPKSNGS